jgi:hypothetical protein
MGAFAGGIVALAAAGRITGRPLPERYQVTDIVLGGIATYKFARIVSKDAVTTPFRAPFTEFKENAGSGEVNEEPRHSHPAHAIGELLTCPFCLAPWISVPYVAALVIKPELARTWAAVFSIVGMSDMLQQVYGRVRTD